MGRREEREREREERKLQALKSKAEQRRLASQAEIDQIGGFAFVKAMVVKTLTDLDIIDDSSSSQGKIAAADDKEKRKIHLQSRRALGGSKDYSNLTKNLAGKILRMGPTVPPEIQELASDAVNGIGGHNEGDLREKLRGYLGIHRSGATRIKRFINSARTAVTNAARVGVMMDVAQRGGMTGAVAKADIIQAGADAANNVTKNKTVQSIAIAVAAKFAADAGLGLRFLRSIGRIARMGGAIGTAAMIAVGFKSEQIAAAQAAAKAQGKSFDAAAAARVRELAPEARRRLATQVDDERGLFTRAKNWLGLSTTDEEKTRRQSEYFQAIANARSTLGRSGVNVTDKLGAYAAERGKSIGQLSEAERAEALNEDAKREYRRRWNSKEAEAYARSQLDRRPWHEKFLDNSLLPAEKAARFNRFRDEFAQKSLRGTEALQSSAAMGEAVAKYRKTLSAAEMLEISRRTQDGIARQESFRNRHKVVWVD
jgi:hypothetical protein